MSRTISQVESEGRSKFMQPLADLGLLPNGYQPVVELHGKARRKRRGAAFENNWSPTTDHITIRYERVSASTADAESEPKEIGRFPRESTTEQTRVDVAAGAMRGSEPRNPQDPGIAAVHSCEQRDLIRALDRAENRPGYSFVSLKWFRDVALPAEGFAWSVTDAARRAVLTETIQCRYVLTGKVQNPKAPEFPVTAIRLNRLMREVIEVIGKGNGPSPQPFRPVTIAGEPLSATVMRDRG